MFKQNKIRSRIKPYRNYHNQKSIDSDNLSLSTSNNNGNGYSIRKLKCLLPTISLVTSNKNYESIPKHPQFITRTLENAAVHFGDFYSLQNNNVGKAYYNNLAEEETTTIKKRHRSNFTRQMVHKLERATDIKDYARQISAFLKETVEPPDFKLNTFLSENSIFDGSRKLSHYPLWYKEPHKKLIINFSNSIMKLMHDP